jgi:hypothetical protein
MPDLDGDSGIGIEIDPEPVAWSTSNFSPMPEIAPPPLGKEIDGNVGIADVGEMPESPGKLKKSLPEVERLSTSRPVSRRM